MNKEDKLKFINELKEVVDCQILIKTKECYDPRMQNDDGYDVEDIMKELVIVDHWLSVAYETIKNEDE